MLTLRYSLVCASLLAAGPLSAATIPLVNPSFEASTGYNGGVPSTVPGWTDLGGTYGQVTDVTAQFTSGLSGTNAIYIGGGILQLTSQTFATGESYTLSLDVGNPSGIARDGSALIFGLRNAANDNYIQDGGFRFVDTSEIDATPDGTFQSYAFTYTATAADNGNAIRIGMEDYYNQNASYRVDNVMLTTTAIPEPSAYAFGLLGLSFLAFKLIRQQAKQHA